MHRQNIVQPSMKNRPRSVMVDSSGHGGYLLFSQDNAAPHEI